MKAYKYVLLLAILALTLGATNRRLDRNPVVSFNVAVTDRKGTPVPGLNQDNFKVYEDGVEQQLTRISSAEGSLALVVLMELSDAMAYQMPASMDPAAGLIAGLRPDDWGAVVTFSGEPEIAVDFTRDKSALLSSLRRRQSLYRDDEVALHDAVYFVLDRLKGLHERTAILLIATGRDTISRRAYGGVLRSAEASDTPIYTVAVTQPYIERSNAYPDFEEQMWSNDAEHTLSSFAMASGGLSFVPQVAGQYSVIQEVIDTDLRNQYTLTFRPSNSEPTTRLRKLKVEVVNTDVDHNGKPDKLNVRHKKGY